MKLLIDIYSDYGNIIGQSSELSSSGLQAENVIDQVPSCWATSSAGTHSIRGSLAFVDSQDFTCPVDSFVVLPTRLPSGTTVTLKLYSTYPGTPVYTYDTATTAANQEVKVFGLPIQLASYWELIFTLPYTDYIVISRVMVGQYWQPTYGVTGTIDISKVGYLKGGRFRNGGVFVPPSVNYKTQKLEFAELDMETCYVLLDSISRYGSGATILVQDVATSLLESFMYGRIVEWDNPKKSVSGRYSIGLNIEEIVQ